MATTTEEPRDSVNAVDAHRPATKGPAVASTHAREEDGPTGSPPNRTLLVRALGRDRYLRALDIALLGCLLLLLFSAYGFMFFYLSFMLLVLGAFFWDAKGFVLRTLFWLSLNAVVIAHHLGLGKMDSEELFQTPLLAGILVMVYMVAKQREQSQKRLQLQAEELALAQQKMAESEKASAVASLSASVAHDLRNPLGAISNAAYYIGKRLNRIPEIEDRTKIAQFLTLIREQVHRSDLAISNLIFFTRDAPPDILWTDIHAIIDRSVAPMRGKNDIRVHTDYGSSVDKLAVDGYLLQYVLINLVHNAVESMDWHGDLTISTSLHGGTFAVSVQDTGKGMNAEAIGQIFNPLFTTKLKGAGLGLPVCQQLIAKHGGEIEVHSQPGEGTTVTVRLPVGSPPGQTEDGGGERIAA